MLIVAYIVLILSFINLARMCIYLVGSDIYDIKQAISGKKESAENQTNNYPLVSVLVPAYNEELTLLRALSSVYDSDYQNIELIIINDSSTDKTYSIARDFQRRFKDRFKKVILLNVHVRGKAQALNKGLKYTKGNIYMCLDADSALTPQTISRAVGRFVSNPKLACISSNIKIFPSNSLLGFFQQLEYLVGYQMKKTEEVANIQYIVGGIGSMYRTRIVKSVGYYDTDTITEDIDLSMKILNKYGGRCKLGYDPKVVVYTEPVYDFKGLLRQRFRWKYGRYQTFLKNRALFLSRCKRANKALSWIYLPYAILSELLYSIEPLIFILLGYLLISYGDATLILTSFLTFMFYTSMHVTAATTNGYTWKERLRFLVAAPIIYLGMYVLSVVEYISTIRGFKNLYTIYKNNGSSQAACNWEPVRRRGNATIQ